MEKGFSLTLVFNSGSANPGLQRKGKLGWGPHTAHRVERANCYGDCGNEKRVTHAGGKKRVSKEFKTE